MECVRSAYSVIDKIMTEDQIPVNRWYGYIISMSEQESVDKLANLTDLQSDDVLCQREKLT